jgi:hypothetical protein
MTPVVQSQVAVGDDKLRKEGIGMLVKGAAAVEEGTDAEGEKPLK